MSALPLPRAARRILVVDDDPGAADALAHLLHLELACDVHTAYDGAEALDKAAELRPDVVIMDISMPMVDGTEAARLLQRLFSANGREPRLVALTALDTERDRARIREAGFQAHLVKPVELDRLIDVLR
jgi:CheY-like chemotaxis protein